ncbi:hypothetical protein P692DRAFT_20414258, partial [Suillus brevipes Sb2]
QQRSAWLLPNSLVRSSKLRRFPKSHKTTYHRPYIQEKYTDKERNVIREGVYSGEIQPIKSQKRVQSPTCLIIARRRGGGVELVAVVVSPAVGVVDDEGSAACSCENGWATLGLGGCELPPV